MDARGDIWQVLINGEEYEADLDTLRQWIVEGSVRPTDKVRRTGLTWIDAGRAPALRSVFLSAEPPDLRYGSPRAGGLESPGAAHHATGDFYSPYSGSTANLDTSQPLYGAPPAPAIFGCYYHPGVVPACVCMGCGSGFCKGCRKLVNNITICAVCGSLCKPYEEIKRKAQALADQHSGFGLNDLGRSLRYPFGSIVGLIAVAVFYGFLRMLPHIYATAISVGLVFACMSYVINQVSMGKTDGGITPDFSDSIWDTLISPIKLGIAVTLITLGPAVLMTYVLGASASSWQGMLVGAGAGMAVGAIWAIFYYPMALLVAGFTQSFLAVVNPLIGLDTMWRMGLTYLKAYIMCLAVGACSVGLGFLVGIATNTENTGMISVTALLLGRILEGAVTFYFSLVTASILGFALYKSADSLDIAIRS
jgi:hypothetical protein